MSRWAAFVAFVCAAFAWVPPRIDRAGLTAIGFAFLALAVGRVAGRPRPALFAPQPRAAMPPMPDVEPVIADLAERVEQYSAAGGLDGKSDAE